jgi:hypothetical protein
MAAELWAGENGVSDEMFPGPCSSARPYWSVQVRAANRSKYQVVQLMNVV